jgi:hypothetical protein
MEQERVFTEGVDGQRSTRPREGAMTPDTPRRRALIAYAAGVAVIAGLMTVVVLSGGVVTARKTMDVSASHFTTMKP